jgi:cell division protein FtsB
MVGNTELAKLYAEVEDCEAEIEHLEDMRWGYDE